MNDLLKYEPKKWDRPGFVVDSDVLQAALSRTRPPFEVKAIPETITLVGRYDSPPELYCLRCGKAITRPVNGLLLCSAKCLQAVLDEEGCTFFADGDDSRYDAAPGEVQVREVEKGKP